MYLIHQSLAASHRHVAASYWTAASDVAAMSAPVNAANHRRSTTVNAAGHRRSTPPAIGQWRRITVVIGGQRWRSTTVNAADHRSTVAVNDGRRWRTTFDSRWITVDHHRSTVVSGPVNERAWAGLDRVWAGFTAIRKLTYHGMLFLPIGRTLRRGVFLIDEAKGASSYGASGRMAECENFSPQQPPQAQAQH
nr:NAD(P)H:quinone oxidoreductase, type IV protein [Tanacetum cinerariifolium]